MAATRMLDRGYSRIVRELKLAARKEVAVGLLDGKVNADGKSIAEYGTFNEFGTDKIPSRPFMRTAFDNSLAAINSDINKLGSALVTGQITANGALTIMGQAQVDRIKSTITNINFTPRLSSETIARKKGSTKTLVDTGAMVNSVQLSIRARGGSK